MVPAWWRVRLDSGFWSLALQPYSLCIPSLYCSWISNWSLPAESPFFLFFFSPPPRLVEFVGWICCFCYILQPLTDFRFLEGWLFFSHQTFFGSPLSVLQLPLGLHEEGKGPRGHLTTQCQLGCAAVARGKDALERGTAFWVVSHWSWAVPASLLWHGERVFFSENCHGTELRP